MKNVPGTNGNGIRDDYAGLLIDRLAATIIDDSLPLKEVERDLRGSVAEVAIKKRGLDKRETANRCGVTEKSIENYLKEARQNPKSPEREIARVLQDEMLSLEEIFEQVAPILSQARNFTLDDAKRALEKLIRTGEVKEYAGRRYRAVDRPAIRHPATIEAHQELVNQKARDLDYIVLRQKEATEADLERRGQRFSRVVGDSNLVRIDFTVAVSEEELPQFYEKLSEAIARLTMKEEKKKGASRVRLLLAMRTVTAVLVLALAVMLPRADSVAEGAGGADEVGRSWELDRARVEPEEKDQPEAGEEQGGGGGSTEEPGDADDPNVADDGAGDPASDGDADDGGASGDAEGGGGGEQAVMRGDVDLNGRLDLSDVVRLVAYLHGGGTPIPCGDAADVDASGTLDLRDALALLRYLYFGYSPPWGERSASAGAPGEPLGCEALESASI